MRTSAVFETAAAVGVKLELRTPFFGMNGVANWHAFFFFFHPKEIFFRAISLGYPSQLVLVYVGRRYAQMVNYGVVANSKAGFSNGPAILVVYGE